MCSFTKSVFTSSWPSAHLCCSAVGETKSWRIYFRPFEGKPFSKNKSLGDQKSFRNPEKFGSKLRKKFKLEKKNSLRVKIDQENFFLGIFFLDEKLIVRDWTKFFKGRQKVPENFEVVRTNLC